MIVYRVPRLTVFGKLPEEKPTGLAKLLHKLRVVVGYLTEYCYFTSACLGSQPVCPRHGRIRRHPCPQSPGHAGSRGGLPQAAREESRYSITTTCAQSCTCPATGPTPRGSSRVGSGVFEKLSVKCADVVIATNESYRAIDIERNGAAPERVFIVRNGPDARRVRLTEPDARLRT